jgi:hypothetical protein
MSRTSLSRHLLLFFSIFFSIVLTGAQAAEEHANIEIPTHDAVLLKFKAFDPGRVLIDEQAVLQELLKMMEKQTKWPLTAHGNIVPNRSGLLTKVDAPRSRLAFEYMNVDRYDSGAIYGQVLEISVAYDVARSDQDFTIRLTPPPSADLMTQSSRGIFRVPTPKLASPDELVSDFRSMLDAAPRLVLSRDCVVTGEKTSTYRAEAIVANFERLLGRYANGSSEVQTAAMERADVFAYLVGQRRVPLKINAVPYRDGTKILFSASLPYTLRADGTADGYDLPAKLVADVDRVLAD